MDSRKKFYVEDIPIYQEWIRNVSGKEYIIEDKYGHSNEFGEYTAWVQYNIRNRIFLNCNWLTRYNADCPYIKASLLHEAGHLIDYEKRKNNSKERHGKASREYAAQVWALEKCSKLGLEKEMRELRLDNNAMRTSELRVYRIAHRMLRNSRIAC